MSAQWGEASIPVPVDPGGEMFDPLGGAPGFMAGFGVIFVVVMIAVAAVFVISIVIAVRKYRVLKDAGVDPLTVDAAIAAKVLRSGALAEQAPASPPPSALTGTRPHGSGPRAMATRTMPNITWSPSITA